MIKDEMHTYEELVAKLKEWHDQLAPDAPARQHLELILPSLRESEGERARRAVLKICNGIAPSVFEKEGIDKAKALAFLEEHRAVCGKPTDWDAQDIENINFLLDTFTAAAAGKRPTLTATIGRATVNWLYDIKAKVTLAIQKRLDPRDTDIENLETVKTIIEGNPTFSAYGSIGTARLTEARKKELLVWINELAKQWEK